MTNIPWPFNFRPPVPCSKGLVPEIICGCARCAKPENRRRATCDWLGVQDSNIYDPVLYADHNADTLAEEMVTIRAGSLHKPSPLGPNAPNQVILMGPDAERSFRTSAMKGRFSARLQLHNDIMNTRCYFFGLHEFIPPPEPSHKEEFIAAAHAVCLVDAVDAVAQADMLMAKIMDERKAT